MKITFEPGSGSFEIILESDEALPVEWERPDTHVLRETSPNCFVEVEQCA